MKPVVGSEAGSLKARSLVNASKAAHSAYSNAFDVQNLTGNEHAIVPGTLQPFATATQQYSLLESRLNVGADQKLSS
ncbi:MAG: hypothetical protein KME45_07525 [Stenomitos rutilans HA7619-LM2]|jgi:hypothetical protein|nr:hypothetical protein [Stenomitos rutilans HA7619-LM2]